MENNIKTICVRLNLKKPLHKKAYDYLKNMNKSEFPSNSQAIATAVVEYFENQKRENRFIEKIIAALGKSPPIISEIVVEKSEDEISAEIDFDFLGG